MPPARALLPTLIRASGSVARNSKRPQLLLRSQFVSRTPSQLPQAAIRVRWQSQSSGSGNRGLSKSYEFEDIKKLISIPSKSRILIDVREPGELQETGRIPGAVNIPVSSAPDAFFVTEEEFEGRFGFRRPEREVEVVFYCKAGVRSQAAARLAAQAGWGAVGEYRGSWMDWVAKGGKIER